MDNTSDKQPPVQGTAGALFVRQASGLVRSFSLTDVTLMNLAGMSIGVGSSLAVFIAASIWPGSNVVWLLVFGGLLSMITVVVYGLMSSAMPRAGGDYVFVGRTLHPSIGMMASVVITTTLFIAVGLYCYLSITGALAPGLTALGYVVGSPSLQSAGTALATDKVTILIASLVVLAGVTVLIYLGEMWLRWAYRILFAIGMLGILLMIIVFASVGTDQFAQRLAGYLGPDSSLSALTTAAATAGYTPVNFSWAQTLLALPEGFFLFVGLTYTTYIGGEIKRPQRSQPLGMLLAVLIGGVADALVCGLFYVMFGWDKVHAIGYLMANAPDKLNLPTSPYLSFFAGLASGNGIEAALIGLSFVAWYVMLTLFVATLPSRNMFAWAFDRLMPAALTRVTARGVPWVASTVVVVLAVPMIILDIFTNVFNIIVNYTLMISITFLIAGVAAAVFPWRRRDLFERAPSIVRTRVAGVPLVAIGGVIQTVVFAYIIVVSLMTPAFSGPLGAGVAIFIAAVVLAGPIWYFVARALRRRQHINLDLMYRELPPD